MKQLFLSAVAACLLIAIGCTKSELSGSESKNANSSEVKNHEQNVASVNSICDVIDFSGITHGTVIAQVLSKNQSWPVAVTGFNPEDRPGGENAAMVFNSAGPIADDLSKDMGTPNMAFGGPGVGDAGASGPFANMVAWGNLLVIKDFDIAYPKEDDNEGAYTTFDFSSVGPITVKSISVIDVELSENETAEIRLYASKGGTLLNTVSLPSTGQNGVATVDLGNTSGVQYVVVEMNGSMGIDNLQFCKEEPRVGCTLTQGYWKTHGPTPSGNNSNNWPVFTMTLGSVVYTQAEWQSILNEPVRGNGLISLAHQLIAARLNIASGASGATIATTLSDADALIASKKVPPVGDGFLSPSSVSSLVDKLTKFNEGTLAGGPAHCD
jgi:hypothetical protein